MGTDAITCGLKVRTDAVARQLEEIISSLPGFRVRKAAAPGPCDVLVLEIGGMGGDEFDFARGALRSGSVKNVFLTSSSVNLTLLREALAIGAKGFFRQPIDKDEVRGALLEVGEDRRVTGAKGAHRRGRVIDVIGAKGGVGTTTVAVNLATSMRDLEGVESVAIIDMDEPFGDVPLFLNMDRAVDRNGTWKGRARLDAASLMGMFQRHPSGLFVLPSPGRVTEDEGTPRVLERALDLMRTLFDYVIVDGGRSLGPASRPILSMCDNVVLVTVLTLPSLVNVRRLLETFRELGYPEDDRVHVVANRMVKRSDIQPEEAEGTLRKKISWTLPNDYRVTMSAINQGKPLAGVDRRAEANVKIRGLAAFLAGKDKRKKKGGKGLFGLRRGKREPGTDA